MEREHASDSMPVFEMLEPRLLLSAAPISGQVVEYVTLPSVKSADGTTFAAGGVYCSTDRGETWQWAMGTGINKAIGNQDGYGESDIDEYWFLGQSESQPDTVYVTNRGTGFWPPYMYTVYKSGDAGADWAWTFFNDSRQAPDGNYYSNADLGWQFYALGSGFGGAPWGFAVNRGDPNEALYTNSGEIFITTDGGASWREAYSEYAPGQSAPTRSNPGRWETTGLEVTSCWNYSFDPFDSNRTYICYTDIGLMRSTDRGLTWTSANKGINWTNTIYQLAFDPSTPGLMWAACSNQHDIPHWTNIAGPTASGGVAISTDYGQNWTSITSGGLPSAPVTSIVVDPTSPVGSRTLYAAVYGYGVYKSTDGGHNWTSKSSGLTPTNNLQICSIQRTSDGTLFAVEAARRKGNGVSTNITGGIFKSVNGGTSWTKISSTAMWWPEGMVVDPTDSNIIYVATAAGFGHDGGVFKTTNGGTSWQWTYFNDSIEGFSLFLNPQNHNTVYFTSISDGMFVSYDAGSTWSACGAGYSPPFRATQRMTWDPLDPSTVYVTTFGGGVWKGQVPTSPTSSPSAWTCLGPGGGGALFYPAASPFDHNLLFVSCDMGGFYRSADGGASWTMLDWRGMEQAGDLVFHPTDSNVIFALPFQQNGDRLMKSADKGLTWSEVGGGAPVWQYDNLMSLTIDSGNPLLMLLSGENGLYRSTDGGQNWAVVPGAPAGFVGMYVDLTSPVADRVILATTADAPYRSDDDGLTWVMKANGLPVGGGIRAFSAASDPAPFVASTQVNGGLLQRSTIQSLTFTFSESVSGLNVRSLTLFDRTTQAPVDLSALQPGDFTWNPATFTAVWSFARVTLADGYYTATLPAVDAVDSLGSPLASDGTIAFFRMLCDSNGDAKVDGKDLALWQIYYDPLGRHQDTPDMGDWNGDGRVDGKDLAVWQIHYKPLGMVQPAEVQQAVEPSVAPAASVQSASPAASSPAVEPAIEPAVESVAPATAAEPVLSAPAASPSPTAPAAADDETSNPIAPVTEPTVTQTPSVLPVAPGLAPQGVIWIDVAPAAPADSSAEASTEPAAPLLWAQGMLSIPAADDSGELLDSLTPLVVIPMDERVG